MEVRVCPNCTAPLGPSEAFCPRCGAAVAIDQGPASEPTQPGPPAAAQSAYEPWRPAPGSGRVLGTIGGQRPMLGQLPLSSMDPQTPPLGGEILYPRPTPAPEPAPAPPLQQARPYEPERVTLGPRPAVRQMEPASPRADLGEMVRHWLESFAARPRNEQVTLSLIGVGWALVIISFFMPWAASSGVGAGIGIGTVGSDPRPGAWAFDTPAGWMLFLLTVVLLGAVVISGRIQAASPSIAPMVRQVTGVVVPIALGGALLGVGLLYLTLPWGCGGGLMVLVLGAGVMVAAGVAALFYPTSGVAAS